jgi:riboflavin kinase/FMN adenylyltransferase
MTQLFRDVVGNSHCPQGSVVCIGAFDGLHRGHQALVGRAVARARESRLPAVAVSFEPLPREYFAPHAPPARLSLPRSKFEGLRALGIDSVGLLRFDARLAGMEAEQFVRTVLVDRLAAREVWAGPDFRYGKGRRGDFASLQAEGATHGFEACTIEPVVIDGERVSSSRLRLLLAAGELDAAAHALGRRYAIAGKVVRGKQLGRKLGYPTANVRLGGRRPALGGIFACRVHGIGPEPRPGVASLGTRPTVYGTEPLLEAHLFDFDGDLYGQRIAVEFVAKLRDEERFEDLPALVRQMNADAQLARKRLRELPQDERDTGATA